MLMTRRSGSADLPLHGGRVPKWLSDRMARLAMVIAEAIVHEFGRDELLRRLANPFWFQSFGAVMGMDWHSSGITTSVLGALKRGLARQAGYLRVPPLQDRADDRHRHLSSRHRKRGGERRTGTINLGGQELADQVTTQILSIGEGGGHGGQLSRWHRQPALPVWHSPGRSISMMVDYR